MLRKILEESQQGKKILLNSQEAVYLPFLKKYFPKTKYLFLDPELIIIDNNFPKDYPKNILQPFNKRFARVIKSGDIDDLEKVSEDIPIVVETSEIYYLIKERFPDRNIISLDTFSSGINNDIVRVILPFLDNPETAMEIIKVFNISGMDKIDYWKARLLSEIGTIEDYEIEGRDPKSRYYEFLVERNVYPEDLIGISSDDTFVQKVGQEWDEENIKKYAYRIFSNLPRMAKEIEEKEKKEEEKDEDEEEEGRVEREQYEREERDELEREKNRETKGISGVENFDQIWNSQSSFDRKNPEYLLEKTTEQRIFSHFMGNLIIGVVRNRRYKLTDSLLRRTNHYVPALIEAARIGNMPLMYQIKDLSPIIRYDENTETLSGYIDSEDSKLWEIFIIAAKKNDYQLVEWMKSLRWDPKIEGEYFFEKALEYGSESFVNRFVTDFKICPEIDLYRGTLDKDLKRVERGIQLFRKYCSDPEQFDIKRFSDHLGLYADEKIMKLFLDEPIFRLDTPLKLDRLSIEHGITHNHPKPRGLGGRIDFSLKGTVIFKSVLEYIYLQSIIYENNNLALFLWNTLREKDPRVEIPIVIATIQLKPGLFPKLESFYNSQEYNLEENSRINFFRELLAKWLQ